MLFLSQESIHIVSHILIKVTTLPHFQTGLDNILDTQNAFPWGTNTSGLVGFSIILLAYTFKLDNIFMLNN